MRSPKLLEHDISLDETPFGYPMAVHSRDMGTRLCGNGETWPRANPDQT